MAEIIKKTKTTAQFCNIGITQLWNYRLPLAGVASILHRISGALLFLLLPFSLYLFELSLDSEISFEMMKALASSFIVKLIILALAWAFVFHWLAGLRYLLMDMHYTVTKQGGKNTAAVVFALSLAVTLAIACKLFGIF